MGVGGETKGHLYLRGVGRGFGDKCTSLAGPKVLGMSCLHGEEFYVLARLDLIEGRSLTWLQL